MLKYNVLFQSLLNEIQLGKWPVGAKLPSVRFLSEHYSCSKSTVLAALKKLEEHHWIYAIPKSGYYVVEHQLFEASSSSESIDFASSSPTWHAFPYTEFQHCINKAINTYQEELFRYGTPKGLPLLLDEAKTLLETYQVFARIDKIFVTSGVQQSLSLLSLMPFPNQHSTILVEQPSYHLYMDMLKTYQLPAIGIRRTVKGIDLNELEQVFRTREIKFFYTMPRFHNPLGTSYYKKEKKAILSLAEKYNVYIVEDDYLADFEYNTRNNPLFSEDIYERVIYLKSFSKIMFPGLRVGLAVLPIHLAEIFQRFKITADIDSSMISQAALYLYLKNGMFERYKSKVSSLYYARAEQLQKSIRTHLPMFDSSSEKVMHTHIVLPKKTNLELLRQELHGKGVSIDLLKHNYLNDFYQDRILKLNISKVNESQIEEGIRKIGKALHSGTATFF